MIRNLITPIRKYSTFSSKHIGNLDYNKIFKTCGVTNINDLINQVIPYNLKTNLPARGLLFDISDRYFSRAA